MTTITAQTILRSRHAQQPKLVLSTLLLRYPRCIHSEFMTHRVFSRNAASSRAIPVGKMIQSVIDDPFVPLWWGKNQPGMQAHEELIGTDLTMAKWGWEQAFNAAIRQALSLSKAGAHKQIINRILEPFAHITVLVSSTEWANFLALRDHPDAEPHIRLLAQAMRQELEREDNIQTLGPGQWHLPFSSFQVSSRLGVIPSDGTTMLDAIRLSSACCASTSYKTTDGFEMTVERARALHEKLTKSNPIHASPFEHVAQADEVRGSDEDGLWWANSRLHGNFTGFNQYRKMLPNECVKG